jgi:hypothetical protein
VSRIDESPVTSEKEEPPMPVAAPGVGRGASGERRGPARTVGVGLLLVAGFGLLMLSPLVLGPGSLNRFVVAIGLAGMLIGGSCVIHGAWDWMIARRG